MFIKNYHLPSTDWFKWSHTHSSLIGSFLFGVVWG
jgi:hypothetical protein